MTERNEDHIADVGKKVGESAGPKKCDGSCTERIKHLESEIEETKRRYIEKLAQRESVVRKIQRERAELEDQIKKFKGPDQKWGCPCGRKDCK